MVMTTSFIRELRHEYPNAYISFVCNNFNKSPIIHNPYLNEIIVLDPTQKKRRRLNPMKLDLLKLISIRKKKYDLSICFTSGSSSSAVVSFLCGAKFRMGVENVWGNSYTNMFYNLLVPVKVFELHEVKRNMSFLQFLGIEPKDYSLEIFTTTKEDKEAQDFLEKHNIKAGDITIGIHHGVCKQDFVWETKKFASISDKLINQYKVKVILFVPPGDEELNKKLIDVMVSKPTAVYYSNSIASFSAVFKKLSLFVCNDSGIMHTAAASGCKVIALFGPSSIVQYGPFGDNCIAIKGENDNVNNITVEMVMDKINLLLFSQSI
jgi:ADP-heptose:LPS heptosyltransferase